MLLAYQPTNRLGLLHCSQTPKIKVPEFLEHFEVKGCKRKEVRLCIVSEKK